MPRSVLIASLLALCAATAFATEGPAARRVIAIGVPLRFTVPGTQAQIVMDAQASVVLHPGEAGKPPAIEVEDGAVLVTAPAGSSAKIPIRGKAGKLVLVAGAVAYARHAKTGDEHLLVVEGEAQAPVDGGLVPVPKGPVLRVPGVGTGDAALTAGVPKVVERLVKLGAGAAGPGLVDLPANAVPPSGTAVTASGGADLQVAPLTGGTMVAALPVDRPTLATDQICAQRQRLLVGLPELGLSGPGFFLDFLTVRPGRVRNVLCTGPNGFVRFFYSPRWLVTLSPGSMLEAEGPDLRSADRSPSRLRLVRGAMLLHGRETHLPDGLGLSELGAVDLPLAEAGAPALKEIVVAAREAADTSTVAEVLLARARAELAPVLAMPLAVKAGGTGAAAGRGPVLMTILADIPMAAENLVKYIPLHVAPRDAVDKLAITMLGPTPAAASTLGGLVSRPGRRGEAQPVALVMPALLEEHSGPQPATYGAFLVRQNLDLWTLRRMADDHASRVGVVAQTDVHVKTKADPKVLLLLVVAVLLNLIPGVRQRLMGMLEMLPGFGRTKCKRCGLVFDVYPIGEFRLDEDHEPLIELLRYDMITEVVRQEKARALILDRIRLKDTPKDKTRFHFRGGWCQRCLSGSILAEIIQNGEVVDETDWEVASADTHKLLKMIRNPARAQELMKE